MKKTGKGIVTEIHNNYGIIQTDSFNQKGDFEDIPFLITREMIVESGGDSYIKYSKDVSFDLQSTDGLRRQGRSFELTNIVFEGKDEYFKRVFPNDSYVQRTIDKFNRYNGQSKADMTGLSLYGRQNLGNSYIAGRAGIGFADSRVERDIIVNNKNKEFNNLKANLQIDYQAPKPRIDMINNSSFTFTLKSPHT